MLQLVLIGMIIMAFDLVIVAMTLVNCGYDSVIG
jgi:hypothetical protein